MTEHYFNPFPGLRSFEEDEDYLFFGREKQVDELLEKIESTHFLAVVGASGSGKSSLVKCGLLPSFHSGFIKGVGKGWRIGVFRPGDDPIGNLAHCFASDELAGSTIEANEKDSLNAIIESILRRSDQGLTNVVDQFLGDQKENVLIVVDQFEELFRFSKYEKRSNKGTRDSVAFINLLLDSVKDKQKRIYVAITMRSDFLGNCTEFQGLPEAINEGQYLIPRMTRDEKKLAITGPIAVGGASITPQLLTLTLNEVGDNPDQLPILQHALMRTFDYWQHNASPEEPIDVQHYDAIGRMANALSHHADEAFNELKTEQDKLICARMFKALTETGTNQGGIRRPTKVGELIKLLEVSKEQLVYVIDSFRKKGRSFLMPPDNVELDDETVIDISHESLMRVWKRLRNWVAEEAESAQTYKSIATAAALYQEGKGGLYRDPELQFALQWQERNNPTETWAMRYDVSFVRAMTFLRQSKEEHDFQAKQKELEQKRKIKRNQLFTFVVSIAFIVATILTITAYLQKNRADEQQAKAIANQKEAEINASEAIRNAEEAKRNQQQAQENAERADENATKAQVAQQEAEANATQAEQKQAEAVQAKKEAERMRTSAEIAKEEAVKQKGIADENAEKARKVAERELAKNMAYNALVLLEQGKREEARQTAVKAYVKNQQNDGPHNEPKIYQALNQALFSGDSSTANLFDARPYEVRSVVPHPTDNRMACIDDFGNLTVLVGDGVTLTSKAELALGLESRSMAYHQNGQWLAVGTKEGKIALVNDSNGELSVLFTENVDGIVERLVWLPGNNNLLAVESNKGVNILEIERTRSIKHAIIFPTSKPKNITMLSQDKLLYSSGSTLYLASYQFEGGNIKVDNIEQVSLASEITCLDINKGQEIAVGLKTGSVKLIFYPQMRVSGEILTHQSRVSSLEYFNYQSHNYLLSSSYDGTIYLLNVTRSQPYPAKIEISGEDVHSSWIYQASANHNGARFFTASKDGTVRMWFTDAQDLKDALKD